MQHGVRVLMLVLIALSLAEASSAQTLGTIAGAVKDASGAVLPGVTVEAASPALIEKVRTVTTDGTGLYRIVNLPPGTYTVTFTLAGFSTVRREGVEVSPSFTATIDTDLRVGIQDTVTVVGESPVVDVQSAAQTRSVTAEQFKELPSSGSWIQMAALVPAVRASVQDVGGILGDQTGAEVSAHGSRTGDGVSMVDGLRIGNMYLSSNLTNMSLSPLLFDQVDVQLSGQVAETSTNGVIMNAIPKSGGNRFSGTALVNGSVPDFQGSNVTDRLQARGLSGASTTLKTLYDINGALGGPIKRDRVWFYATSRYFTNEYYLASKYFPVDVTAAQRVGDTTRQAYGGTYTYDNNGRITWAMTEKQKLSSFYAYQYKVDPHWLIQIFQVSPEAARITTWHTQLSTNKWTYVRTNRLLFEAGVSAGASPDTIKTDLAAIGGIALVDQATGLNYRAPTNWDWDDHLPSQSFNVSTSYVTGSHNAKVGFEMQRGHFQRGDNNDSTGGIWYTVNNTTAAVPQFVTIQAPLSGWQNNLNYNLGFFAQDRWTVNRLTISGGVRLDMLNESTEPFTAKPHTWLPTRSNSFAAVEDVPNWKDVNPRVSAAYDLFGNGRTAIKASASRGVEQDSIRFALVNNPATTLATQTSRAWTDSNLNFSPDCDLHDGLAQDNSGSGGDICGPWLTPSFGSAVPAISYDPNVMKGWGVRPWNWEFSAGIQHELAPRISASFSYFRRINGNFLVIDNEALTPADFTEYSVTLPNTSTLSGSLPGAGQTLGGFYDQNAIVAPRNVIKDASQFGKQQQHWDGIDLTVDARLRGGLLLQGGVSTGKTMTDICEIIDDVPESLLTPVPPPGQANQPGVQPLVTAAAAGAWTPKGYCHQETPYLPQYKAIASYTLPFDVRVSGTYQSVPGPQVAANTLYANAGNEVSSFTRTTFTTLNRPFTNTNATLNVIEPGTLYGDRLNQFDFRFTKVLNVGTGRLDLNLDLYNAFNSDAITLQLNNYGPVWQLPLTVIQPRFVKLSARWDF